MSGVREFAGKIAFVTGGASGIGLAAGCRLAAGGAHVVLTDRDAHALAGAAAQLQRDGLSAEAITLDVTDSTAVEAVITRIVRDRGGLHLAVNSAGVAPTGHALMDYDETAWRRLHDVNLHGVFICTKFEMAAMRHAGGSIVNIASVLGLVASPYASAYCAAKHGVVGLSKAAALEGATLQVRVNALCPGFIDTPLLRREAGDRLEAIIARHPVGRIGTAEEVAEFAAFLLSDRAGFVTGAAHVIDGGYSAM
jgi:NAD(P)-dependent dehydrogenase (short-subunit alcohol dehydrogenase family)